MASEALAKKIRAARAFAVHEVPKARLCAEVIYALIREDDWAGVQPFVDELKSGCGSNWSPITALQFMSGRRGEFAAEAAPHEERARLMTAHLFAKEWSHRFGLGAVQSVDGIDMAKLRSLAQTTGLQHR